MIECHTLPRGRRGFYLRYTPLPVSQFWSHPEKCLSSSNQLPGGPCGVHQNQPRSESVRVEVKRYLGFGYCILFFPVYMRGEGRFWATLPASAFLIGHSVPDNGDADGGK